MNHRIAKHLVVNRHVYALLSLIIVCFCALGGGKLYFESDYRIFFADDNPQLLAHETIQEEYTKTDNLIFVIGVKSGDIFTPDYLNVIDEVTQAAWETPYSIRVDSLSNFQYSYAEQDDMIVEDLVDINNLTPSAIARVREIALDEVQLVHRLISSDAKTTAINVSLELPAAPEPSADAETQAQQRQARDGSFPEIVDYARGIQSKIMSEHPDLEVYLLGVPIINQSFNESSQQDAQTLVLAMYVLILVLLACFLRSIGSVVGILTLIGVATIATVGLQGWFDMPLNQVNITAPVIILTIGVCDCVHLLVIYLRELSHKLTPVEAMTKSLDINLQPIILTSVTTAIGFLSLNFSDSPPFQELGTICAIGVLLAMLLSFTLLPAISIFLTRARNPQNHKTANLPDAIAELVIKRRGQVFASSLLVALALIAFIPQNKIDDDTVKYFKKGVAFRDAADFHEDRLSGNLDIAYSIDCGAPGCINDPTFLQDLERITDYFSALPEVRFVDSYTHVIKRLNQNMNQGQPDFYASPESQNLAAQYQLMYEMSLPYGLDLNNQINFDKSAAKIQIIIKQIGTKEFLALEQQTLDWLHAQFPDYTVYAGSIALMFGHIGITNISSMLNGSIVALIGVTLTLLFALRSLKFGLISLLPNSFPAAMAFGLWGILISEVNLAVAVVFSVTLGIVVDDTVHFLSKYLRARREQGNSPEDAIRYAFSTVGSALLITTVVLTLGFFILVFSSFNVNAYMGAMVSMTILIAVVFDFLFLPALILLVDKDKSQSVGAAAIEQS